MKMIYPILFCFLFSISGYAQFDSSGYRYLFDFESTSESSWSTCVDSNIYILKNSGKRAQGINVTEHNLINKTSRSSKYLFDKVYTQREISNIGIEQFAVDNGRLALLTNQGIFYANSVHAALTLLSSEISAFEFNSLEFSDSLLFVYRNSFKALDAPFFEVVSLNLRTKEINKVARDDHVNAKVYSNFQDSKLVAIHEGEIYRADCVFPTLYRYKPNKDSLLMCCDPQHNLPITPYLMPIQLVEFLNSYTPLNSNNFLDTTIKLKYVYHYSNRQLISDKRKGVMILTSSCPDSNSQHSQFIMSEFFTSDSGIVVKNILIRSKASDMEKTIQHATEVIDLANNVVHITQDDHAYYFVLKNATNLSPVGMKVKDYVKTNYPLQFGNTGFAVIRLEK